MLWPIHRCAVVIVLVSLASGCASLSGSSTTQLDNFMAQERAWAGLTDHRVTLPDGTPVTYSEGGAANAPTLILLHGYSGDRNHWNRVARELTDHWHLIVPDLPGHGATPLGEGDSAGVMANTMGAFADAIGASNYVLVGHSMGGAVAMLWAMGRPEQTRGLVLIDSAGVYADNPSPVMKAIARGDNVLAIHSPGDYDRLLKFAMAKPPFIPDSIRQELAEDAVEHSEDQGRILATMLNLQKNLPPSSFQMMLNSLRMPVFILWGRKDQIFDVRVTQELADGLSDAQIEIIDDVGHTPIREAPRRTAQAIDAFASSLPGS